MTLKDVWPLLNDGYIELKFSYQDTLVIGLKDQIVSAAIYQYGIWEADVELISSKKYPFGIDEAKVSDEVYGLLVILSSVEC